MLTLKQFYIAQMLKGTNAAYPARETGEEIFFELLGGRYRSAHLLHR